MPADFGLKVRILQDDQIQKIVDELLACMNSSGLKIDSNINDPGIAALINSLVRAIEASLIAAYEPLIALINVVTEAVKAGIKAPIVFIEKIAGVIKGLTELLAGLPLSIIDFIVNKVISPITENINIPFPNIEALIQIILGKIKLPDIDWEKWLVEGKLVSPPKLKAKGDTAVRNVLKLFQSFNGLPSAFLKLFELLLFPIKFAIGLIESVIKLVGGLVKNIFDAIAKIIEIISNPVKFVLDTVLDIIIEVITPILKIMVPIKIPDISMFKEKIKELIQGIITPKFKIDEWISNLPIDFQPIIKSIIGVVKFIGCFLKWFFSLINPKIILSLFGLGSSANVLPSIESEAWIYADNGFVVDPIDGVDKIFKPESKIEIKDGQLMIEATVKKIEGKILIVKEPIFGIPTDNSLIRKGKYEIKVKI